MQDADAPVVASATELEIEGAPAAADAPADALPTAPVEAAPAETVVETEAEQPSSALSAAEKAVREGLGHLGVTANGLSHAFLTLRVRAKAAAFGGVIDAVAQYPHLQDVALPSNGLTSLAALAALPYLTRLDVSGNSLSEALSDVLPPPRNLTGVDLSHNAIGDAGLVGLAAHRHLRTLDLSGNKLTSLAALAAMAQLEELRVDKNAITSLQGLEALPLRSVSFASNAVDDLAPLVGCAITLCAVRCTNNRVARIAPLAACERLGSLDVRANSLSSLEDLRALWALPLLHVLDVRDNPSLSATVPHDMRLHVLHILPRLTSLDAEDVSAKEKVHAANLHGADAAAMATIRDTFFPSTCPGEIDTLNALLATSKLAREGMTSGVDTGAGGRPESRAHAGGDRVGTASAPADIDSLNRRRACFNASGAAAGVAEPHKVGTGLPSLTIEHVTGIAELVDSLCGKGTSAKPPVSAEDVQARAHALYAWVVVNGADLPSFFVIDSESVFPQVLSSLEAGTDGSDAARRSCTHAAAFEVLARVAHLHVCSLTGFLKGPAFLPGASLQVPNAAWNALHLPGDDWKMVDCALAAESGRPALHFVRSAADFVYDHYPVLGSPGPGGEAVSDAAAQSTSMLSANEFWSLPQCSPAFFEAGLQLLTSAAAVVDAQHDSPDLLVRVVAPEPGVSLSASMVSSGDLHSPLPGAALVQREAADVYAVRLCVPCEGTYYAHLNVRDERIGEEEVRALSFKVVAARSRGLNKGPKQQQQQQQQQQPSRQHRLPLTLPSFELLDCRLFHPMSGTLEAGSEVGFKIRAPGVTAVMVGGVALERVGNEEVSRNGATSPGASASYAKGVAFADEGESAGVFVSAGPIKVGSEGALRVACVPEGQEDATTVLEYTVVAPAAGVNEAAPPAAGG